LTILALAVAEISLEASKFKMGHVTLTTPLSAIVCHPGLALATISLSTKFEVSITNHYVDITGDTKRRKLSGVG